MSVGSSGGSSVDGARQAAAEILREKRFLPEAPPQPLRRPLSWLGERLRVVGRPLAWLWRTITSLLPGRGSVVWVVVVLVSLAIVVFLLIRSSRSGGRKTRPGLGHSDPGTESADDLERFAVEAERDGDWAAAVRLLFRAGLRRLADQHAVHAPDQRPNADVARELADPAFGTLAERFDQVVYALAPASANDVEAARRSWPGIVRGAVERARREREARFESALGRTATNQAEAKKRWWRRRRSSKPGDGSR